MISWSKNLFIFDSEYKQELLKLKKENIRLKLTLQEYSKLREENDSLRNLLKIRQKGEIDVLPLQIIGVEPSSFRRRLIVDKGAKHGVTPDALIVNEMGVLIGKIKNVEDNFSEIIFINDPQFYATVRVADAWGLLKGTLDGRIKVFYIEKDYSIKRGEKVLAVSAGTNSFLEVGEISQVKENSTDLFLDVYVSSYANLYPPRVVFMIKNKN